MFILVFTLTLQRWLIQINYLRSIRTLASDDAVSWFSDFKYQASWTVWEVFLNEVYFKPVFFMFIPYLLVEIIITILAEYIVTDFWVGTVPHFWIRRIHGTRWLSVKT